MSEFLINKARTVCFSGHRAVKKDFDIKKLNHFIDKLIKNGFNTFLLGMALGFDSICFRELEKVRKVEDIKIIACIPCETQSEKFNKAQKEEYDRMLNSSDYKICLSKKYTDRCMQKRNEFMVDNSSVLVTYLRHDFGGTKNTVNYALKNNVPILEI